MEMCNHNTNYRGLTSPYTIIIYRNYRGITSSYTIIMAWLINIANQTNITDNAFAKSTPNLINKEMGQEFLWSNLFVNCSVDIWIKISKIQ